MDNLNDDRLGSNFTEASLEATRLQIRAIGDSMPFLLGLTEEEQKSLNTIRIANRNFVERVTEVMPNNTDLLPVHLDFNEIVQDFLLFQQLEKIQVELNQITVKVHHSRLRAGAEAYAKARAVYKYIKVAYELGVPGAEAIYKNLKERYQENGKRKEGEEEEPNLKGAIPTDLKE